MHTILMSILLEEQNRLQELLKYHSDYQEGNPHKTREKHEGWVQKARSNLEEVTVAIDAINKWRKDNGA